MPRLLTGEIDNPIYIAIEVALICFLVHAYMKDCSHEVNALTTGVLFGLYDAYLQKLGAAANNTSM